MLALVTEGCATTVERQVGAAVRVITRTPSCFDSGCIPETKAHQLREGSYEDTGCSGAVSLEHGGALLIGCEAKPHRAFVVLRNGERRPFPCQREWHIDSSGALVACIEREFGPRQSSSGIAGANQAKVKFIDGMGQIVAEYDLRLPYETERDQTFIHVFGMAHVDVDRGGESLGPHIEPNGFLFSVEERGRGSRCTAFAFHRDGTLRSLGTLYDKNSTSWLGGEHCARAEFFQGAKMPRLLP